MADHSPLLPFLLLLLLPSLALAWPGRVVSITDGDTITVLTAGHEQVKVRLYGIDAPEKGQAFGQLAKRALSALVAGADVDVQQIDSDRYGRTVAILSGPGGLVANEEMVRMGYAWVFDRYCKRAECNRLHDLEAGARADERGLWADGEDAVAPWEWRRRDKAD